MKNSHCIARLSAALLANSILVLAPIQSHAASIAPVAAENAMVVTAQDLATKVCIARLSAALLANSILVLAPIQSHAASIAPVAAENAMVVTAQDLATKVGID